MNGPSRREDARSVALIIGGGLIGVVGTAALAAALSSPPERPARHETLHVRVEAPKATVDRMPTLYGFEAGDRLWGRVETRSGAVHTGFIRWDRNEGSWADVLDANKDGRKSGIRFGHIRAIDATGRSSARLTLRSGGAVELDADATDLGTGLRALVVDEPGGAAVRMTWNELQRVEFEPAPDDLQPSEARIHGTLTTDSGLEFTGYVTWNVEDIYTTDVLDARDRTAERRIPFGAIASIERRGSRGAEVVLSNGSRLAFRGGEDVGLSNGTITVSDPYLGEVKLGWNRLASVRFHPPAAPASRAYFDGGGTIRGTVTTNDGTTHAGVVVWDRDEAATWEMLDGSDRGIEFQIEFGNLARVARTRTGALVQLRDGRIFHLRGSNDVNASNRGIIVGGDGRIANVPWGDFATLTLEGR